MHFENEVNAADLKLLRIRVKFNTDKISDVEREIYSEFDSKGLRGRIETGASIGVTAGSRGIANIDAIIAAVCRFLKESGANPFIIPAMGSHGGATAKGQKKVLEKLGITEKTMGAPIFSSMDAVKIGDTDNGSPVYLDKYAYEADGIIVVNRIKPHTDFTAGIESGLMKMLAVGLGKAKGCSAMHSHGLGETIPKAANVILGEAPVLMGLAILENSKDETYKLKALWPEEFETSERALLLEAKANVPRLPMDYLDVLIVEEIGKMYSGTGMDTKVIGRMKIFGEKEPERPKIRKIVALNLAKSSAGNALGVGLADITTKGVVDSIDFDATYANTIATTFLERSKIPVTMKNDHDAVRVAINTVGGISAEDVKLAIIKNTLELEEMYVTEAAFNEMEHENIEILERNVGLVFDSEGKLDCEEWEK